MKTLSANELKEYIRHAIDLEGSAWGLSSVCENFNQAMESRKPQLVQEAEIPGIDCSHRISADMKIGKITFPFGVSFLYLCS